MILNYKNALSAELIDKAQNRKPDTSPPIVHFGVGGFHRAHQAWALQKLQNANGKAYRDWGISGVCIMPQDVAFVEALRAQDCLYFVQSYAADGLREDTLVSAIWELLHPAGDYALILERIAAKETKVISFTITEGGYNVDYKNHTFIWETAAVQNDLKRTGTPQTVFRILAEGLRKRMETAATGVILLSCDNVQHNGDILKFALLEFLKKYDEELIPWIEANVSFVKTMVDRITPATSKEQKAAFTELRHIEDECLVVCEDFFQWVIQKDKRLEELPYAAMGASLVTDVAPYEKMKLRLLNAGHSLTGLLGDLLGYDRIHTSISDPLISRVYRRYCLEEVYETLDEIEDVDYDSYVEQLVTRFSNPMINDSTARIISGSTDKLPKFVIPVMLDQLAAKNGRVKWSTLILAAWYCYLERAFKKNQMTEVIDLDRDELLRAFKSPGFGPSAFIDRIAAVAEIKDSETVRKLFVDYVGKLSQPRNDQKRVFINQLLETQQ